MTTRLDKAHILSEIAHATQLDRKSVALVLESLLDLAKQELNKPGGEFVIPGILKLKTVAKPATQDRSAINPFTKLNILVKGKPASKKIKVSPLKVFKDAVESFGVV